MISLWICLMVMLVLGVEVACQEAGCDGVVGSGHKYDDCGICAGRNSCKCDRNDDTKRLDNCGYCGVEGDALWNNCFGCDGIANSGFVYDRCGVCEGRNVCVSSCDFKPYGEEKDECGVCGGDGSSCAPTPPTPQPSRACSECGVDELSDGDSVFCECVRSHIQCARQNAIANARIVSVLCNATQTIDRIYHDHCPELCEAVEPNTTGKPTTVSVTSDDSSSSHGSSDDSSSSERSAW
eukprot:CAMPEP_0168589786 /NCGR_PEP_ID=MMETSP0420-20121227/6203_1 /TAXON_ID=498008 /ORGANISM="Pessonella sp." /LENGTH=237 /DNA_ID=CAMNT_0008625367 /DNA_START=65 /DNA_END=775 /DNA_ORIENTATION=-